MQGIKSAIDYVIVNGKMREIVSGIWIDENEEIDVVTDHNVLVVECRLYGKSEGKKGGKI